jgi:hypothetical protein
LGTFSIALIFILFPPAEKSYLASMTEAKQLASMVTERGPIKARPK